MAPGERVDQLGQAQRLVLRYERPAVGDLLQARAWDHRREALGEAQRELRSSGAHKLKADLLAHMLMGALDEAALLVVRDPAATDAVAATLERMLDGLRADSRVGP
jgi:hypothetical protein